MAGLRNELSGHGEANQEHEPQAPRQGLNQASGSSETSAGLK